MNTCHFFPPFPPFFLPFSCARLHKDQFITSIGGSFKMGHFLKRFKVSTLEPADVALKDGCVTTSSVTLVSYRMLMGLVILSIKMRLMIIIANTY